MNFCFRHRHTTDHECKGPMQAQRSVAAQAAESRKKPTSLFTFKNASSWSVTNPRQIRAAPASSQVQTIQSVQGDMVSFRLYDLLILCRRDGSRIFVC